jgi:hypothetical protein
MTVRTREQGAKTAGKKKAWTVHAFGVTFVNGERVERPLEDFSEEELKEIAYRKNLEAMSRAGYRPVKRDTRAAV